MSTSSELIAVPELEEAKELAVLAPESRLTLKQIFTPFFIAFKELEQKAADIAVNKPKAARETRLALRKVRTGADKARSEAGAQALLYKKSVDGLYKLLEDRLSPIEKRLSDIEHAEEIAAQEVLKNLRAARIKELTAFVPETELTFYDLGGMPEAQYQGLLKQTKDAFEAKVLAIKQAEEARIAAEQAKEAERKRLEAENARLAAEAAARQKALEEAERKASEERKKAQAEADRLKKEAEDKLAAERAKAAEAQRKIEEQRAKERAELEAKQKAEQAKRDEENAKKEAAAKIERDRLAAQAEAAQKEAKRLADEAAARKAKEDAEKAAQLVAQKKAAAAPDKDKLIEFANMIGKLKAPTLKTAEARAVEVKLNEQLAKFAKWLTAEANKL